MEKIRIYCRRIFFISIIFIKISFNHSPLPPAPETAEKINEFEKFVFIIESGEASRTSFHSIKKMIIYVIFPLLSSPSWTDKKINEKVCEHWTPKLTLKNRNIICASNLLSLLANGRRSNVEIFLLQCCHLYYLLYFLLEWKVNLGNLDTGWCVKKEMNSRMLMHEKTRYRQNVYSYLFFCGRGEGVVEQRQTFGYLLSTRVD